MFADPLPILVPLSGDIQHAIDITYCVKRINFSPLDNPRLGIKSLKYRASWNFRYHLKAHPTHAFWLGV